jgi:hypothetical protein
VSTSLAIATAAIIIVLIILPGFTLFLPNLMFGEASHQAAELDLGEGVGVCSHSP